MHSPCSSTEEDVVSPEPFGGLKLGRGMLERSDDLPEWPLDVIISHSAATASSVRQQKQM